MANLGMIELSFVLLGVMILLLGSGVWIAMQAFVCPFVSIADNSVVGARAVVASDVPTGSVVAGNPARVIGKRVMRAAD